MIRFLRDLCYSALFLCCAVVLATSSYSQTKPVEFVDPMLGVEGGGNVFPGSTLPFGMVKLGPDTEDLSANAGYSATAKIVGFSHLHVSGTGGGPKYGNILLTPVVGTIEPGKMASDRSDETASVGYYGTKLTRYGIIAELTATRRVGVHRYTFPESKDAHIAIDLAHCLTSSYAHEAQKFTGGEVRVVSATGAEGAARYTGGWNVGGEYSVYFVAEFSAPAKSFGTWTAKGLLRDGAARSGDGSALGAFLDYDTSGGQVILAKVAISFISIEQARKNLRAEMPGWDFDGVRKASVEAWERALAPVKITSESADLSRAFYTALYHNMLMPVDRTGEQPKWKSAEPSYDDYYAIWDTFRSTNPLITLIHPEREIAMVRALVDIYRHEGYMPDARSGNDNGRTQGGSNANVLIADAWVKGLKGIDYETAFAAMVKDAEVPPANPRQEGRGGLEDYNAKGYVTTRDERSGSRTMEYAYDDFAIAEVARGLGHRSDAAKYLKRAGNWRSLWNPSLSSEGVTGFIHPRNEDGTFLTKFTPTTAGSWPDVFYEADSWEYSLYAPQDVAGLIEQCGGKEAFVRRLDTLFDNNHYDVGNEPGFLLPILYVWAGRHDRTADRVTQILAKNFGAGRSRLPGNDDSGAMSAWFAFHAMGFFPVAGQDLYVIGTPAIAETEIDLGGGRRFRIIAHGLDPAHRNRYVQSATLNGKPLERAWFHHSEIIGGATLVLNMGDKPSGWGTNNPPPSPLSIHKK